MIPLEVIVASLDTMLPKYDTKRASKKNWKIQQYLKTSYSVKNMITDGW